MSTTDEIDLRDSLLRLTDELTNAVRLAVAEQLSQQDIDDLQDALNRVKHVASHHGADRWED